MKKLIFIGIAMMLLSLSSCSMLKQSAATQSVKNHMASAVVGELQVSSEKITYTYYPTLAVRKVSRINCINMAIHEALKKHGSGDILVETSEAIITKMGLFGRKIKSVTVSGYPATYVNFTPADKEVVEGILLSGEGRTAPVVKGKERN